MKTLFGAEEPERYPWLINTAAAAAPITFSAPHPTTAAMPPIPVSVLYPVNAAAPAVPWLSETRQDTVPLTQTSVSHEWFRNTYFTIGAGGQAAAQ